MTNVRGRIAVALILLATVAACQRKQADPRESIANADRYLQQGRLADAIVELRRALQIDPRLGDARLKLANAYEQNDDHFNATREYIRAADALPDDLALQMKAGNLLLSFDQFEDAKARAETVLAKNPQNIDAQILRGNALAGMKDFDGAIARFNEVVGADPTQFRAFESLGALQYMQGDAKQAETTFKAAIEHAPTQVSPRIALANLYWTNGRAADAERSLKEALDIDPKNVDANRALGIFYLVTHRPKEAEPFFAALATATPSPDTLQTLAQYYVSVNRYDRARTVLEQLGGLKEGATAATLQLATLDALEGQRDSARRRLTQFLGANPGNLDAYVLQADLFLQDGMHEEAQKSLNSALAINSGVAKLHEVQANLLRRTDRPTEAAKELETALSLDATSVTAMLAMSELQLSLGAPDKAVTYAQKAVDRNPASPEAATMLVRSYLASGNTSKPKELLAGLQKRYPRSSTIFTLIGALQESDKNFAGARASYARALELEPKNLEAVRRLALVDVRSGRGRDAIAQMNALVAPGDASAATLLTAAAGYYAAGDAAKAEAVLLRALERDPKNQTAYSLLGRLYQQQNRRADARRQYEQLLTKNPRSVPAHMMLGILAEAEGRRDEAAQSYEKALSINPDAALAANNLAWIYVSTDRNLEQALSLAQTAKRLMPDDPGVNDTIGWIYVRKGMATLAIPPLERAVQAMPEEPIFNYHLGQAYLNAEQLGRARPLLAKAAASPVPFEGIEEAKKALAELH